MASFPGNIGKKILEGMQGFLSNDTSKAGWFTSGINTQGALYTLTGNNTVMCGIIHNSTVDSNGNFTPRMDTGTCEMVLWKETGVLSFYIAPSANAGTLPVFSFTMNVSIATGQIWFSASTQLYGITGVNSALNKNPSYIGEYLTAALDIGSATSLTTNTSKTIISQSLTAGDWEVEGIVNYIPNTTTSITQFQQGASSTDNTLGADNTYASRSMAAYIPGIVTQRITIPRQRFSLAVSTTVYLIANATFTASTMTAYGALFCRRMA